MHAGDYVASGLIFQMDGRANASTFRMQRADLVAAEERWETGRSVERDHALAQRMRRSHHRLRRRPAPSRNLRHRFWLA